MEWYDRKEEDEAPIYLPSSEYFTLYLHHSGIYKDNVYENGVIDYFDFCCADRLSKIEIDNMAKVCNLAPSEVELFWFLPKVGYDDGIMKKLVTDQDVIEMAMNAGDHRVIHVYVEDLSESISNSEDTIGREVEREEHIEGEVEDSEVSDDDYEELIYSDYKILDGEDDEIFELCVDKEVERDIWSLDKEMEVDLNSRDKVSSPSIKKRKVKQRYPEFNDEKDMKDPELSVG
ncbi:unnamed protein product [Cuscuta europaea]|uniref:PB1-like domain-containing protein n=1 Tax=Cuscuta europaea TaxID=41803 RepID=A0A9P1DX36_CUSEU|nr:unnamed protein product [Cuscuta europaea]